MTSATDELRRLLDEHGVEWKDGDAAYEIEWSMPDGRHCSAMYWKPTFTVLVSGCTPEQAIAATLGSGTCENVAREWEKTSFAHACTSFCCSECGAHYVDAECYYAGLADKDEEQIRTNFCPNCGRKVVGE